MKVHELIERLREFDPETEVMVWNDFGERDENLDIIDIEYDEYQNVVIEIA
jgi:hypothetical protein